MTVIYYKIVERSLLLAVMISSLCVGLSEEKPGFEPQGRHNNKIRKEFRRRFSLNRFLAKTLRVNKIAMKSFSKKSVIRSRF